MENNVKFRNIFKENLIHLMEEKQATQKDLATYMNLTPAAVNDWMRGKKIPRMDKIDRLCQYFNITRSELLTNTSQEEKEPKMPDGYEKLSPEGRAEVDRFIKMRLLYEQEYNLEKKQGLPAFQKYESKN